jgi:hypothetical protein
MQGMESLVKEGLALMRRYLCWFFNHDLNYYSHEGISYALCNRCNKSLYVTQ